MHTAQFVRSHNHYIEINRYLHEQNIMSRFVFKNIHYALKNNLMHNANNKIFTHDIINVHGNFIIKIEYKKVNNLFVLYHTEVPIEHRGHNLGSLIAQDVFDYLIKHNIKTAVYCPFLLKFMKKYPDPKLQNILQSMPPNII